MFFIALLLEEEVLYVEYSVYEHQVSSIHTCTVQTLVLRLFLLHMYVQFKRRVLLYHLLVLFQEESTVYSTFCAVFY